MTCYFPVLVSDFDWLKLASSNQKHVVTRVVIRHDQYGISVHISQSSGTVHFFMREGGLVGFGGGGHSKKISLKGGASRKKMKERRGGGTKKLD